MTGIWDAIPPSEGMGVLDAHVTVRRSTGDDWTSDQHGRPVPPAGSSSRVPAHVSGGTIRERAQFDQMDAIILLPRGLPIDTTDEIDVADADLPQYSRGQGLAGTFGVLQRVPTPAHLRVICQRVGLPT